MKRVMLVISILVFCLAVTTTADQFRPRKTAVKPEKGIVSPGYDRAHVEVKFTDGADIGLSSDGVPYDRSAQLLKSSRSQAVLGAIREAGGSWRRMSGAPETMVDGWITTAEENLDRGIADLNNYFILSVPDDITTEEWLDQLNSLDEVEIALAMPLPMPAPSIPGNFQANQGYLLNAPGGFGFQTAWGTPGGNGLDFGASVQAIICDFEYSWNASHQDLQLFTYLFNPALTPVDPFSDDNHGTAVMGELGSISNGWGTTGAVYKAINWTAPTNFASGWDIGGAMTYVMMFMPSGGVFLIEQQMVGPNYPGPGAQDGLVPIEWWQAWYNVVLTAVGNGIHVVAAAGNGQENLDAAAYSTANGGHWPFLSANNSGAIIVGAGAAPASAGGSDVDRSRLSFSNWGSRLNLQGWGERVMTTGYGSFYSAEGKNLWYRSTFSGTSSAAPLVASCVASLEAVYEVANGGTKLAPSLAISTLVSTGTPQQTGTNPISENIGPRPNLVAAINALNPSCCIGIRGDVNGDGGNANILDLTFLVDYIFRSSGNSGPCPEESDVNGDGSSANILDLTFLVDFIFRSGAFAPSC